VIDEGDRGHVQARGLGGEGLGMLRAFEKRERRLRMQLDEHDQS